jgi:hypothetical protein
MCAALVCSKPGCEQGFNMSVRIFGMANQQGVVALVFCQLFGKACMPASSLGTGHKQPVSATAR